MSPAEKWFVNWKDLSRALGLKTSETTTQEIRLATSAARDREANLKMLQSKSNLRRASPKNADVIFRLWLWRPQRSTRLLTRQVPILALRLSKRRIFKSILLNLYDDLGEYILFKTFVNYFARVCVSLLFHSRNTQILEPWSHFVISIHVDMTAGIAHFVVAERLGVPVFTFYSNFDENGVG